MVVLYIILAILGGIVGLIIIDLLFLAVLACFVRREQYDKPNGFYRAILTFHYRLLMILCNIGIKVSGREKLKQTGGKYLIVANHISNYDPFVTVVGLKEKNLAFITKPENFKVPIFGKMSKKCCYLAIDRENPRNAMKTILKAAEILKNGTTNICVYPEGTRNHGNGLLPFHDGVFKIAQKAECPVVVAAITGTDKTHKRAPFLRTTVKIEILRVIGKEEVESRTSHDLSGEARRLIAVATGEKERA